MKLSSGWAQRTLSTFRRCSCLARDQISVINADHPDLLLTSYLTPCKCSKCQSESRFALLEIRSLGGGTVDFGRLGSVLLLELLLPFVYTTIPPDTSLTNPFGTRDSDIHRGSFVTESTGHGGYSGGGFSSESGEFGGDMVNDFRLPRLNQDRFGAEFIAVSDNGESTSAIFDSGLDPAALRLRLRLANHHQTKTASTRTITTVMPMYLLGPNLGK